MDPRGQTQGFARYASHILQFKPGRDVALLNAMLNVIVAEGMVDIQYVQAHTDGFESLKAKVADFTPEKMEPVCGIPAATIREVARLYARSERSLIFWGMGISQHTHGTDNARCLIALALVTGQVGRPGTGLHPLRGQNNVQGASDAGLIPMFFPDYKSVEDATIRSIYDEFWGTTLPPKRGLTVVEIMHAIKDGVIKGMYVMGENPAMSDPDVQHAREALAQLEHLVVQDIFLTETAWHADVILPASAHAEKWGTFTNTNRQVQIGRPVISPPGEARLDWALIQEIAQRIGLNWAYKDVSEVFGEMAQVMPSLKNITWERLVREDAVTYPCDAPDKPGNEIIFGSSFPTASGRAKIVPADLVPPDELPDEAYPLVLTTGRLLEHWHTGSMTRRASNLDAMEPEAIAGMNPREMDKLGIDPGGFIRVSTTARHGGAEGARRPRRCRGHGVHPVLLRRGRRQPAHQPAARPHGQDPRVQVLRLQGRAGRADGRCRIRAFHSHCRGFNRLTTGVAVPRREHLRRAELVEARPHPPSRCAYSA